MKVSGSIEISYILEKMDNIVKILKKTEDTIGSISENVKSYLEEELDIFCASEPVRNEMLHSPILSNSQLFSNCHFDLIADMLCDVRGLGADLALKDLNLHPSDPRTAFFEESNPVLQCFSEVPIKLVRRKAFLIGSLELDIEDLK